MKSSHDQQNQPSTLKNNLIDDKLKNMKVNKNNLHLNNLI